jgi:hypothetical protein
METQAGEGLGITIEKFRRLAVYNTIKRCHTLLAVK